MTFTINKEKNWSDGSQKLVKINEEIKYNEALGDQIGISKDDHALWFDEYLDLENDEVQEFIDNYFTKPISVALHIQKMMS